MYRKQVRRRRLVLVGLIVISLILLSSHFSEADSGPLHTIQRGVSAVFAPVGEVASRGLKPVRDLINWFDETFDARGENDQLKTEVAKLRAQLVAAEQAEGDNEQFRKLLDLQDENPGLGDYALLTGRVNERSPTGWKPPASAMLVSKKHSITLGGEIIDILFLGRAHTGGDLSVSLPRQKILFLSETFLNRVFPAMRSAYPSEWLKALDRAEAMKADVYIAGHGFTEKGPVSNEEIRAYHRALGAVIAEATRLRRAGVPVEDAVKEANWGEYASWTLASSQGPIAIRRVYAELNGQIK